MENNRKCLTKWDCIDPWTCNIFNLSACASQNCAAYDSPYRKANHDRIWMFETRNDYFQKRFWKYKNVVFFKDLCCSQGDWFALPWHWQRFLSLRIEYAKGDSRSSIIELTLRSALQQFTTPIVTAESWQDYLQDFTKWMEKANMLLFQLHIGSFNHMVAKTVANWLSNLVCHCDVLLQHAIQSILKSLAASSANSLVISWK